MTTSSSRKPYVLGLGGSKRIDSFTEKALQVALRKAEALGAETNLLNGPMLEFPLYAPDDNTQSSAAQAFLEEVRRADGFILASPSYHCGISGLLKNAIDYIQYLSAGPAPYFSGRAVGIIAVGAGWQGAVATLNALRITTHALRGWPTPMGVPINAQECAFSSNGDCLTPKLDTQLATMAGEVMSFAQSRDNGARAMTGKD